MFFLYVLLTPCSPLASSSPLPLPPSPLCHGCRRWSRVDVRRRSRRPERSGPDPANAPSSFECCSKLGGRRELGGGGKGLTSRKLPPRFRTITFPPSRIGGFFSPALLRFKCKSTFLTKSKRSRAFVHSTYRKEPKIEKTSLRGGSLIDL